jgi:hypothetical protein
MKKLANRDQGFGTGDERDWLLNDKQIENPSAQS